MTFHQQIYIQSKGKAVLNKGDSIRLKDLIDVFAEDKIKNEIDTFEYKLNINDEAESIVVSILSILQIIKGKYPQLLIMVIGEPTILINMKKDAKKDKYKLIRLALVTFLLFIGSMTAIINFHSDVNMKEAHRTMFHVITGYQQDRVLLLQIPYSLGIGIGMSVFFNHVFKKRINIEPSPLEVEMYLYQQNMDEYLKNNSNNSDFKGKDG